MDSTNKTLALLLVAAIIVSLGGTMVSLNRLGQLQLAGVTGRATTTGTANISITATYVVNVTDTLISFGAGSLAEAQAICSLNSNGTNDMSPASCGTWAWSADKFVFENVGSETIHVNISSGVVASAFLGGDSPGYAFICADTESEGGSEAYPNTQENWTEFTSNTQQCVTSLASLAANDAAGTYIQVNVSTNANTGVQTDTVTFTAITP